MKRWLAIYWPALAVIALLGVGGGALTAIIGWKGILIGQPVAVVVGVFLGNWMWNRSEAWKKAHKPPKPTYWWEEM